MDIKDGKVLKYSQSFIEGIKSVFPDNKEMIKMAEDGTYFLGRLLDDSSAMVISVQTVLQSNSLEELKGLARIQEKKKQLYIQWEKEVK